MKYIASQHSIVLFHSTFQIFNYKYIFAKFASMKTWSDSCKALFYHPAWIPEQQKSPAIKKKKKNNNNNNVATRTSGRRKYDPKLPFEMEVFILGNFFASLVFQQTLVTHFDVSNYANRR